MDEPQTYEQQARQSAAAWRDAAYQALIPGPMSALDLGKATCPGNRADRVFAGLAVRRAAQWPSYFVVNGSSIDLVPWDYNRRKTV